MLPTVLHSLTNEGLWMTFLVPAHHGVCSAWRRSPGWAVPLSRSNGS
jgi:hypothetical protein